MNLLAAVVVVTNLGFTAWFDTSLRIPLCVEYDLEPCEVIRRPRVPLGFTGDPRIPMSDANSAYSKSGYDRGHMAPAADFNWSPIALRQTYMFSNIAPQRPSLNRGPWLDAESAVRSMAASGTVHVITVAVPGTNSLNGVNVPSGFHKFAVGPNGMRHWYYPN